MIKPKIINTEIIQNSETIEEDHDGLEGEAGPHLESIVQRKIGVMLH